MNDNKVINSISLVSLIGRVLILFLLTIFWRLGGFRLDEGRNVLMIIAPLSVLFLTAFIRFAVKYPYALPRREISLEKRRFSVWILILGYLIYVVVLSLSALSSRFISFDVLTNILMVGEALFAIYTATILGSLFEKYPD